MSKQPTPPAMKYLRCLIRLYEQTATEEDIAFIENFELQYPNLKMQRPRFSEVERKGESTWL